MKKYFPTKMACYVGYVVQAIVNNFLPILFISIQNVYALSYERLARLIVVNFVTQMITDSATPRLMKYLNIRQASVLCHFCAAGGLAALAILPRLMSPYYAIMICIVVYAFGSGLIEVLISPMVEALPTTNKSGNMALLHSFYCWGQAFTVLITTLLVTVFGYSGWAMIPLIWAVIPFLNGLVFCRVPLVEPSGQQHTSGLAELLKAPGFFAFMVMMLCSGASELAMAQWTSLFAQKALGVSKVVGDLAGPCAFALLMGVGRVIYALISERVNFGKILSFLSLGAVVCYLVVAFSPSAVLSLVCCALCGMMVSVSWPGIYSAGSKKFPSGGLLMFSIFAMCGDIGCCLGPWVLGLIADVSGLQAGFALAAVFPATLAVISCFTFKNRCKTGENRV